MMFYEVLALEQVKCCYGNYIGFSCDLLEQLKNSAALFKVHSVCGFLLPGMVLAV